MLKIRSISQGPEISSAPAPDMGARTRSQRIQAGAVLTILAGTAAAVAIRDPDDAGSYGVCPSLVIFGVYCPGCGALRAMVDVVRGDLGAAVGHNLLFLPALVGLVVWGIVQLAPRVPRVGVMPTVLARYRWLNVPVLLLTVLVIFTVLRNLSGSALAP